MFARKIAMEVLDKQHAQINAMLHGKIFQHHHRNITLNRKEAIT